VGWCGGTDLFDGAMDIFWEYVPEDQREEALEKWYDIVTDGDWDCEAESDYYVPYIVGILHRRNELSDEDYQYLNEYCDYVPEIDIADPTG
jgi:hypothetical protein